MDWLDLLAVQGTLKSLLKIGIGKGKRETLRKMPQIFQDIGKGENFGDENEDTIGDVGLSKVSTRKWPLGWDLRNNKEFIWYRRGS